MEEALHISWKKSDVCGKTGTRCVGLRRNYECEVRFKNGEVPLLSVSNQTGQERKHHIKGPSLFVGLIAASEAGLFPLFFLFLGLLIETHPFFVRLLHLANGLTLNSLSGIRTLPD